MNEQTQSFFRPPAIACTLVFGLEGALAKEEAMSVAGLP